MTIKQLQNILSPQEFKVLKLLEEGLTYAEIADRCRTTEDSVKQAVRRIKTKTKDTEFAHILDSFSRRMRERPKHGKVTRNNLHLFLSSLEYQVFTELEESDKSYTLVAKNLETSADTIKQAVSQIKLKIGSDFQSFYRRKLPATKEDRNNEKDDLVEKLRDRGHIKKLYNWHALGIEPESREEKNQLDGFLKNKERKKQLKFLNKSQKHPVVPITAADLKTGAYKEEYVDEMGNVQINTRYPVKDFLLINKLKPAKVERDVDEKSNNLSVYYYVLKNTKHLQILMALLIGKDVEFSIEDGSLSVKFQRDVLLNSVYIRCKNGKKAQQKHNKDFARVYTIQFQGKEGRNIVELEVGSGKWRVPLPFELTIRNYNGKMSIDNYKILM